MSLMFYVDSHSETSLMKLLFEITASGIQIRDINGILEKQKRRYIMIF